MSDKNHPYYPFDQGYGLHEKQPLATMDSVDRIDRVSSFNLEQCEAALINKNITLQKTVKKKIEVRIRRLEKSNKKTFSCPDCSRDFEHRHCPECGDVNHAASECDMLG